MKRIILPNWIRVDGSLALTCISDLIEAEAEQKGYTLGFCGPGGVLIQEIPMDGSDPAPPFYASEYLRDWLEKNLNTAGITRTDRIFDRAISHIKQLRHLMKTTIIEKITDDELEWVTPDASGTVIKNDVWKLAVAYGWPKDGKKDFFHRYFGDCPNGDVVKIKQVNYRGWRGCSFTKSAAMKLKILNLNK